MHIEPTSCNRQGWNMRAQRFLLGMLALLTSLALGSSARAQDEQGPDDADGAQRYGGRPEAPVIETVYNLRSIRVARTPPTEFCQATGWPVLFEDLFDLRSYRTRAVDGRVVTTGRHPVGSLRACIGVKSVAPLVLNFFAEFVIGDLVLTGVGTCTQQFAEFPIAGTGVYVCNQNLASPSYVGGQLVTSTVTGPQPIGESDPNALGLHETSFATIRLWRLRE